MVFSIDSLVPASLSLHRCDSLVRQSRLRLVAARIIAVAQPRDAIEEFLTRDVIDLTCDILRRGMGQAKDKTRREFEEMLKKAGLTMDDLWPRPPRNKLNLSNASIA
jgi:hypothetical protein